MVWPDREATAVTYSPTLCYCGELKSTINEPIPKEGELELKIVLHFTPVNQEQKPEATVEKNGQMKDWRKDPRVILPSLYMQHDWAD